MSLVYSKDALNVLRKFHRTDVIIYVEGEDDRLFWDNFYKFLNIRLKVKFKPAGGCDEIDKLVEKIVEEDAKIILIRDRDYWTFFSDPTRHIREIYGIGHSIENTVYSASNITKCISVMSGSEENIYSDAYEWLVDLEKSLQNLQILEIASTKKNATDCLRNLDGVKILGDNPFDLIDSKPNEHKISFSRLNMKLSILEKEFSEEEIKEARILYKSSRGKRYRRIRGHFMTGLVYNYIMHSIDRVHSNRPKSKFHMGATYSILVGFADSITIDADEIQYFRKKIKSAMKSLGIAV